MRHCPDCGGQGAPGELPITAGVFPQQLRPTRWAQSLDVRESPFIVMDADVAAQVSE